MYVHICTYACTQKILTHTKVSFSQIQSFHQFVKTLNAEMTKPRFLTYVKLDQLVEKNINVTILSELPSVWGDVFNR